MQHAEKLVTYFAETATNTVKSLADGVQLSDAAVLLTAMLSMPDFKTAFPEAKAEIVAATDEQLFDLKKLFKSKFDLTNDKAEARVERLFNIGIETVLLIEGV